MVNEPDDPVTALGSLVQAELDRRVDASISTLGGRADGSAELWSLLTLHRFALAAWLAAVLRGQPEGAVQASWATHPDTWLRVRVVRWLRRRNQFIELDAAAVAEIEALCRRGLVELAEVLVRHETEALREAVRGLVRARGAELAGLVRARLGAEPREVVSSEYTPTLQLGLLGFAEVNEVVGPVLDVGCGVRAGLVLHLRAHGVVAEGIDRDADPAIATVADWLRYPYGVDRWGTVVSHLGFSLHLLHHHLAGRPAAYTYTEVYMQILRSLGIDGVFAYAPGLPFLERLLPRDRYRHTRIDMPQGPVLRAAAADTGLIIGHATQVRRIG